MSRYKAAYVRLISTGGSSYILCRECKKFAAICAAYSPAHEHWKNNPNASPWILCQDCGSKFREEFINKKNKFSSSLLNDYIHKIKVNVMGETKEEPEEEDFSWLDDF